MMVPSPPASLPFLGCLPVSSHCLIFMQLMQAHDELQNYKADCERRLQLAEAKAAEARVVFHAADLIPCKFVIL